MRTRDRLAAKGLETLQRAETITEVAGHVDRPGTPQCLSRFSLIIDVATALSTQAQVRVGPGLTGLRQAGIDVRGDGFGREVIGGQKRPALTRWPGPIGDLAGGLLGEPELGRRLASGLSSFHRSPSYPE